MNTTKTDPAIDASPVIAEPAMAEPGIAELWQRWMRLWNGEFDLADKVVGSTIKVHFSEYEMPNPAAITSPGAVAAWIGAFRSAYGDATLVTELGPLVAGEYVVGLWHFHGTWDGGKPAAATAPAGTVVSFRGVDILRLEAGRIAEYWLTDNWLDAYAQLGAVRQPALAGSSS